MHVCCLDRGRTRDGQRMEQWIERKNKARMKAAAAEIEVLFKVADRLADKLVEQFNEKRKREFGIRLNKRDVESTVPPQAPMRSGAELQNEPSPTGPQ